MGDGSLNAAPAGTPPSWKLAAPHDKLTQGLVISGFADLPFGRALFLRCADAPDGDPRAWLRALQAVAPVTDADGRDPRAAAIAFTYSGLERLGLGEQTLASFSAPFREGMFQEDRLRRLGDRIDGVWQSTVVDGSPIWSGNIEPQRFEPARAAAIQRLAAQPAGPTEQPHETAKTVHALLLLYEADDGAAAAWAERVGTTLAPHGVTIERTLSLDLHPDESGFGREHFGFRDGISQPLPYDDRTDDPGAEPVVLVGGQPAVRDRWHGVPLGEFLFGHVNGHHEKAPGPLVPDDTAAAGAGVPKADAPEGFVNLGLDGSYLVVRELRQDVAAFWASMTKGAAAVSAHDPTAPPVTEAWLAERVVGRSLDGDLLCPAGYLTPAGKEPGNAFGFFDTDREGLGCPPGAHVRRGNPRDGLAKDAASTETLLDAANNHRILRRGRKYGPKPDAAAPDAEERGLLFMCLNTDIARQFEFVQQTWILNTNFATLFEEADPLVGPKGAFTIKRRPLRRIVEVETFVQMAGGEYFFLPSLPALRYLATT